MPVSLVFIIFFAAGSLLGKKVATLRQLAGRVSALFFILPVDC